MTRQPLHALPLPPAASDGDEVRLVLRVAGGELAAFEQLYRLYRPRLSRFVEHMTRRPALVGEVLDDTLFVVWRRAATFNGRSKVSTWIFAIAYRKALKALRRLDEPAADANDEPPDLGPGPEQLRAAAELRRALVDALAGLSPEHRAAVELTYFHGLSCRDIAEIADCPLDTVKTRLFYARQRLKTLLPGGRENWL